MAETTEQYRNRINQLKTGIENEPYIKKMREDIAEGISKTGNRQADIEVRQDILEDDFVAVQQDARSNTPSGAELAVAAGPYNTLGERLDAEEQKVAAQLAQTEQEVMRKRELEDLSATVLAAIEGGEGTSFELMSIPQDKSVTIKKLDSTISSMLEISNDNLFNGVVVQGVVDSSSGNLSFEGDSTRLSTGFIKIDSKLPIKTNWLELVQPSTVSNQTVVFYDSNKRFIMSINSTTEIVLPPTNSVYMKQNLKSGSSFSVDDTKFLVIQQGSKKLEKIESNKKELELLNETLGMIEENIFNGVTVQGVVDSSSGNLVLVDNPDRLSTGFIKINQGVPFETNWLDNVQPQTIANQTVVFYDSGKNFIGSLVTNSNVVTPISEAVYMKQNLKSGSSFYVEPSTYSVTQTSFKKTKELDALNTVLEITDTNVFDGSVSQGVIDSKNGKLIFTDDPTRTATDFMKIELNVPVSSNWLKTVAPKTFTEQTMAFYNENKAFIGSVTGTSDVIQAPVGAVYARQNLTSGASFTVDLENYQVYQNRLLDSNRVRELESGFSKVNKDIVDMNDELQDVVEFKIIHPQYNKNTFKVYDFYDGVKTDSEIIADCLNFASVISPKTIVFDTKNWRIDEAILLQSDTEVIVDGVVIKQNDEVYDNVFRGANLVINPDDPNGFPLSISKLKNVKITGINGAKIEGPDVNRVGIHPKLGSQEMVGDFWGWRAFQVSFSLGSNIEFSGFNITKTRSWSTSFDRCNNFHVHDLILDTSVKNGDGVDVRAGCYDFKIENITGHTYDDTVACTALNLGTYFPTGNYIYPLEPSSYLNDDGNTRDLDIYNGTIKNIKTSTRAYNTRLLCSEGIQIYGMQLDNIEQVTTSGGAVVNIHTGYGDGYVDNDIHDIRVNNITSNTSAVGVLLPDKVDNVWLNKIIQNNVNGVVADVTHSDGVTITNS